MVTTEQTMDQHSLEIKRDGHHVGYIMWHPKREPRIVLSQAFAELSLTEIESVIADYKQWRRK